MASSVSHASPSAQDAQTKLKELQRQADILAQKSAQKSRVAKVQEFQKNTRDIIYDNSVSARDIGKLKANESRLNLFSALNKGDKVDVFRFSVDSKAQTRLGVLVEGNNKESIRVQIFTRGGNQLIADSGTKENDPSFKGYDDLLSGKLELGKGDYILRISRNEGVDSRAQQTFNYAIQLNQGLYKKDYDTVEKAAQTGDNPYGIASSTATTNLRSGLADAASFILSLPKIGASAIEKLSGTLYNSLF